MALVLIIDDEPLTVEALQHALSEAGYETVTAADGISGLEQLNREPMPDIVLVDLVMPGMGGRALILAMRADQRLKDIPVILMTAEMHGEGGFPPEEAYQANIPKPFAVADVVSTVRDLLARRNMPPD